MAFLVRSTERILGMREVVYRQTEQGDLVLRIYEPETPGAGRPGIVFYFGGGWNGGNLDQFKTHSEHLARHGMVAVCAEYRVKSRHGTTPLESTEDGRSAFRWVRAHAEELGIDPDRLAAGGGSAGGQVALAVALAHDVNDAADDLSVPTDPSLLVLFNPACQMLTRADRFTQPELASQVSPLDLVDDRIPPSILFYGSADPMIEEGRQLVERSRTIGVDSELHVAEGEKHAFFNREPWKTSTIDLMHGYLHRHGYVEAPSDVAVEAEMYELQVA